MTDSTDTTALPDDDEDVLPIEWSDVSAVMMECRDRSVLVELALIGLKTSRPNTAALVDSVLDAVGELKDCIRRGQGRLTGGGFDDEPVDGRARAG
jgi:hypothetical protein